MAAATATATATEAVRDHSYLLMEILLRLPPKSLFRFMCVSKSWKHAIPDPWFLKSYSCRGRDRRRAGELLGLFQRSTKQVFRRNSPPPSEPPMNILLPLVGNGNTSTMKQAPPELGYFINSSNGLILCGRHPYTYNVVNPLTRKFVSLPPPPPLQQHTSIGLTCEENTSELIAKYTVVRAERYLDVGDDTLRIQTYSSTTGNWAESTLVTTADTSEYLGCLDEPPSVMNGLFHWYGSTYLLLVYDPNGGENLAQVIHLPGGGNRNVVSLTFTRTLPEEGNVLCFGNIDRAINSMSFWMLPDRRYNRRTTIASSKWVLVHKIRVDSLWRDPVLKSTFRTWMTKISLQAFINPYVVLLRVKGDLFVYNSKTKSVNGLRCSGSLCVLEQHPHKISPYFESFFLSSYSLPLSLSY